MTKFPSVEEITSGIHHRVEAELAGRGIEWLASEVGVDPHTILRSFHEGPSYGLVWDMAEALNVSVAYLMTGVR
ncbi:hypothetical protein [Agromyces sp. CF514]|uniref:hypothetical protein n=1 Tax=Agromyces sp. CF514 TaxID=1881031 RepID=UPI001160D6DE|nr:hypothetical protein [Agromyces sp. CF514]